MVMFAHNKTTTDMYKAAVGVDGIEITLRVYKENYSTPPTIKTHYLLQVRSKGTGILNGGTGADYWREYAAALNTVYDVHLSRNSDGQCTFIISLHGGSTVFTRTFIDNRDIQYFIPMCGRGGWGGAVTMASSGTVYNFELL
jgi:hypothetical protein